MALIRRLSRLFAADVHAVLDQIEEPESLLRQSIREMEEELARQHQREKWLGSEIEAFGRRVEALAAEAGEIDAKLDIAFRNDNEALARRLTRRKLESLRLAERTAARREALERQRSELATLTAGNADQLESLRQKAALIAADAPERRDPLGAEGVGEDDVEVAYLREKQARMPA